MSDDQQDTVSSKASVVGLLDEAPMTTLHYYYWLLASGGTLLDGFSVVSLGIAIPLLKQEITVTPVLVGLIGSALVGPNATTFTLPPILFPTAIRASASGFAAACAKVGATFGTLLVPQLQEAWGLTGVLALMAFVSVGGLLTTAAFAHAIDREDEMEETVKGAHRPI